MRYVVIVGVILLVITGIYTFRSESPIDIAGTITQLNPATADSGTQTFGVILVEADVASTYHYDKASVTITNKTILIGSNGKKIHFSDLATGQKVEVSFIGGVDESYPVQAEAGKIVVLE